MRILRASLAGLLLLATVLQPLAAAATCACPRPARAMACCAGVQDGHEAPAGPRLERRCCCKVAPLPASTPRASEPMDRGNSQLPGLVLAAAGSEAPRVPALDDSGWKVAPAGPRAPPRARHILLGVLLC